MTNLKIPADQLTPRHVGRKVTTLGATGTLRGYYTNTLHIVTLADTSAGSIVESIDVQLVAPRMSIDLTLDPTELVEIHGVPAEEERT